MKLACGFGLVACIERESVEACFGEESCVVGGSLLFHSSNRVRDHHGGSFAIWGTPLPELNLFSTPPQSCHIFARCHVSLYVARYLHQLRVYVV